MPSYSKSHLRIETKKKKERGEAKADLIIKHNLQFSNWEKLDPVSNIGNMYHV